MPDRASNRADRETRELTGEKLAQFKEVTSAFVTDMETITNDYQAKVDEVQQTYIDALKEITLAMSEQVKARTAQYLQDIAAIIGEPVEPEVPVEPPTEPTA